MIINYTISGKAPAGYSTAVAAAVQYMESALTNNVTVNLVFQWTPLGAGNTGTIAQTTFGDNFVLVPYATWRSAMLANAQGSAGTADNLAAAQGLPTASPFASGDVSLPWQLAQAEGITTTTGGPLPTSDPVHVDATIALNSNTTFTFDPNNRAVSGAIDAIGALEHEISEALGRTAGSDGSLGDGNTPTANPLPLNFFRYTATGAIDTADGWAGASFGLTGNAPLIPMGEKGGDLADWSNTSGDAVGYASSGQADYFTAVDLQAMSALGWQVASNATLYVTVGSETLHATNAAVQVGSELNGDVIIGDGNTLTINQNFTTFLQIIGNGETVTINGGSGDTTITGSSEKVVENGAGATLTLGGNGQNSATVDSVVCVNSGTINIADNSNVTISGVAANVETKSNDIVTDNAATGQVIMRGGNTTLNLANGANISLQTVGDTINAGGGDTLLLVDDSLDQADTVNVAGAGTHLKIGNAQQLLKVSEQVTFAAGGSLNLFDQSNVAMRGTGVATQLGTMDILAINGGNDTVQASGSGDSLTLSGTAGNWDTVNGSGATMNVTGAQASISGGSDTINLDGASSDAVSLYGTAGAWDTVNGSSATVIVNGAQASVLGGGDVVWASGGSSVSLYNTNGNWGTVYGTAEMVIANGVQTSVLGGGDVIWASGGSVLSLYNTGGNWDTVNGSGETVIANGVQASVLGGSDVIWASGGSSLSLYNTGGNWDTVNGSGETVILTGAQASINGGGDTLWLNGGATVSLYGTGTSADTVGGSGAFLALNGVAASVNGNGDTFWLGGTNTLTLAGNSEQIITAKTLGDDTITGFNSTDHVQFSASNFADWAHLLGATKQSGSDTIITLDAGDQITLKGVLASSLSSSQFAFT